MPVYAEDAETVELTDMERLRMYGLLSKPEIKLADEEFEPIIDTSSLSATDGTMLDDVPVIVETRLSFLCDVMLPIPPRPDLTTSSGDCSECTMSISCASTRLKTCGSR